MSWGFFLDVELAAPTAAWKRWQSLTPAGHGLAERWWGFLDHSLEDYFSTDEADDVTVAQALAAVRDLGTTEVTSKAGATRLRLVVILDRAGEPYLARCFAALIDAARGELAARGRIALVNDGTFGGESGVEIKVANGTLDRTLVLDYERRLADLTSTVLAKLMPAKPARKPKPTAKQQHVRKPPTKPKKRKKS